MLIDATHAEETRVVVLDGNRLEDFDVETSTKRQIKGNIYLAKIVRVEPSLQAAFVEYGGNRHGFLSFDEIHPDYYQIPVADRQRLLALEAEEARREQEEDDRAAEQGAPPAAAEPVPSAEEIEAAETEAARAALLLAPFAPEVADEAAPGDNGEDGAPAAAPAVADEHPPAVAAPIEAPIDPGAEAQAEPRVEAAAALPEEPAVVPVDGGLAPVAATEAAPETAPTAAAADVPPEDTAADAAEDPADAVPNRPAQPLAMRRARRSGPAEAAAADADADEADDTEPAPDAPPPETLGGENDTSDEPRTRRIPSRFLRSYKIQEVIHRRQILLVQVEKEERGTKGAALTTYVSLAGRYSVLMPNSPRGGGISRKITAPGDRRRLKEVMSELDLPEGMGLIVRTAGANRPKPEIKRDAEYLLRLWDDIRETTMKSVAPALIYEEASLIKRAIRDVYSRDVDEIAVDGEDAWRAARDFMRMLMPSHAKKVQLWHDPSAPAGTLGQPLFARHQVDAQLDAMMSPNVQLRSGGYLVINQTEALVAIDVNSGRSTRERGIEETALRTNLEAADEVARQLRLRDLAGLVVIDFIDMESRRNNAMVEKRMKEALKADRARIQLGHISHFGLLEMSRQRLRPSLAETSQVVCAHCGGTGHVRSTESAAIHVLRAIEEEGAKRRAGEILVHAAMPIVLYILNHKRDRLSEIEARHGLRVAFAGDDSLIPPQIRITKLSAYTAPEAPVALPRDTARIAADLEVEEEPDEIAAPEPQPAAAPAEAEASEPPRAAPAADAEGSAEDEERRRRRRRRRRRGGRREDGLAETAPEGEEAPVGAPGGEPAPETVAETPVAETEIAFPPPSRRRRPTPISRACRNTPSRSPRRTPKPVPAAAAGAAAVAAGATTRPCPASPCPAPNSRT